MFLLVDFSTAWACASVLEGFWLGSCRHTDGYSDAVAYVAGWQGPAKSATFRCRRLTLEHASLLRLHRHPRVAVSPVRPAANSSVRDRQFAPMVCSGRAGGTEGSSLELRDEKRLTVHTRCGHAYAHGPCWQGIGPCASSSPLGSGTAIANTTSRYAHSPRWSAIHHRRSALNKPLARSGFQLRLGW